ncbi:hypothetical protein B0T26DRAFT_806853 [Lasiosphaeria miniovina]|uniref:BCNT-C domain-containing protein n=1 Tax=Lasiosphaeria miniovina TaxID=1954250 RepID=A0AA40DJ10_9PEZI|nr:uncharacterized protein B0T26DRAFT_806853 [Lasiosphaeria miniovina]KAK0703131.1 hypothetical protein B0T26DRAFT_806853 [Lasiosphaeria miniovina]
MVRQRPQERPKPRERDLTATRALNPHVAAADAEAMLCLRGPRSQREGVRPAELLESDAEKGQTWTFGKTRPNQQHINNIRGKSKDSFAARQDFLARSEAKRDEDARRATSSQPSSSGACFLSSDVRTGRRLRPPRRTCATSYFKAKPSFALTIAATGTGIGSVVFPAVVQYLIPQIGFPWAVRCSAFVIGGC